jgi:hypothetical protein
VRTLVLGRTPAVREPALGTVPIRGQSPRGLAEGFVQKCRDLGLLLHALSADTVAVRPPLVAKEKDVDFAAEVVGKVLAEFDKKAGKGVGSSRHPRSGHDPKSPEDFGHVPKSPKA